jgi:glyoxylase-like metal-dependent hydrolase (beta-lactamase superfamily II)
MDCFAFRVGELDCWSVSDGTHAFPAANFFENAPPEELDAALSRHGVRDGQVAAPFCCLVAGRVLIDAGFGDIGPKTGQAPARLRGAGIEIETILLSHGHADHAAGALAFPDARLLISRAEFDFWFSPASEIAGARGVLARRTLAALRERFEFFDAGDEVLPGLRAIPAPGHTPHNLAIEIRSNGEAALYVADAIAHPIHLERPEWYPNADLDPVTAVATRRALLARAAAENMLVCAYHMPFPGVGRIGWSWRTCAQG